MFAGSDYERLSGKTLKEFKELNNALPRLGRTSQAYILFESGVHLTLQKTEQAAGRALRRLMADEVFPQLARDGRYSPRREVVDGRIVDREPVDDPVVRIRLDELELRKREMAVDGYRFLRTMLADVLPDDVVQMLIVKQGEVQTGTNLQYLLPAALWQIEVENAS